jgi:choline kinase
MKAVILAAGRGYRLRSVSQGRPKCLLRFGDDTILDFQISALLEAGVDDIALVVGYEGRQIVEHMSQRYSWLRDSLKLIWNPKFAETNNIYSLWLARTWVGQSDFICLNADVLCHPEIILPAVRSVSDVSMIIDPAWRDDTMKVMIRQGHIIRMGNAITKSEYSGTYIGVTTFYNRMCRILFPTLETLINQGRVHEFFNVAVQRMIIMQGIQVEFTSTQGLPWAEIDDPDDLRYAITNVYPALPCPFYAHLPESGSVAQVPPVPIPPDLCFSGS